MKSQSFMKHSVWFPQGVTVAISILTKMLACWRQRLSPLDSKRTQHVTMKWLCQLKGWGKKTNPHWFDFHGPPTPFPMIDPGLVPIQKDNKNTNQSSHSYWGARAPETILLQMRRNREKKKRKREERMNHQSVPGHLGPLCLTGFICAPSLGRSTTPWACWLSSTSRSPAPGRRSRSGPVRGKGTLSYWRNVRMTCL